MSKPMYLNVRMSCLASFLSFEKKTIALELNSSATSRSSTRLWRQEEIENDPKPDKNKKVKGGSVGGTEQLLPAAY